MDTIIVSAGLACIIAAIAGGGLKAFNIEIPGVTSVHRQLLLGGFGALLLLIGLGIPSPPSPEGGEDSEISGGGDEDRENGDSSASTERRREFDLLIGDSIEPGVPGPGAGELEDIGAEDVYRFEASAGDRFTVVTEALDGDTTCQGPLALRADVYDPEGRDLTGPGVMSPLQGNNGCRSHVFEAPMDGIYELVVYGPLDSTGVGTYRLRLADVSG